MCSYATAAMTLPGAQQPRLAPVLPARCSRAVTAELQIVRVTGALTLPGAQQPRLAPVLPPVLLQTVTSGLRSRRVDATGSATAAPGAPVASSNVTRCRETLDATAVARDEHVG